MPRISIPDGPDIIQRRMYAKHQPAYLQSYTDMMTAVYSRSILPHSVRELVRYRIALLNGCAICRNGRVPSEKGETLPEELYSEILSYATSPRYSAAEKTALEFAKRFVEDHHSLDDTFFDRLHHHFSESEIVDLAFVTARHMAFGRLLHVLALDDACEFATSHAFVNRLTAA